MFVLLHPSTQCNVGQYLQNCPFSMIVDSSWRVETVLLWTELCLRSWLPLLHALQTDHEGLPGCKGRSFICESSSYLMRVPVNRLCCPWEIQRHGTPPSTHPSTKLVFIKTYLTSFSKVSTLPMNWSNLRLQNGMVSNAHWCCGIQSFWTHSKMKLLNDFQ